MQLRATHAMHVANKHANATNNAEEVEKCIMYEGSNAVMIGSKQMGPWTVGLRTVGPRTVRPQDS